MAAKNASRPRPNKNKDGLVKKPVPTMSHDISITPGEPPEAPPAPGAPPPGHTNPLTHPNHPVMQSAMGTAQPGTPPLGPSAKPADNRQVQERIQYKDLPAPAQNQVQQQQGIDPYAPIKMAQQATEGALQQGPSTGPVPNEMVGPYVPPDTQSFPDDFAHLQTLMQQGFAPGSSHQEHAYAMNADALHRAMAGAQNGAPPTPMAPATPGPLIPPPQPELGSAMGSPSATAGGMPPQAPGAPGGIPPELIAALIAKHKRPGAMR